MRINVSAAWLGLRDVHLYPRWLGGIGRSNVLLAVRLTDNLSSQDSEFPFLTTSRRT